MLKYVGMTSTNLVYESQAGPAAGCEVTILCYDEKVNIDATGITDTPVQFDFVAQIKDLRLLAQAFGHMAECAEAFLESLKKPQKVGPESRPFLHGK